MLRVQIPAVLVLALSLSGVLVPGHAQTPVPPFAVPQARGPQAPPAPRELAVEVLGPPAPVVTTIGDYYIAPGGRGTTCSQTDPCARINDGIAQAQPGQTIIVAPGTYAELLTSAPLEGGTVAPLRSGVTVRAATPGTVTLVPPADRPGHWAAVVAIGSHVQDITLEGLRLVGDFALEVGIEFDNARGIVLRHLEITGFRGQGIQGNRCDGCTFSNLEVHGNARRGGQTTCGSHVCGPEVRDANGMCPGYCHGIYLGGDNLTIDGGRWHNNDGYGQHLYPQLTNSTVRGSCVWGNGAVGIGMFGGSSNTLERVRVWNNGKMGIWNKTGGSTLRDSQVSGNGTGDVVDEGGLTVQGTQVGEGVNMSDACGASAPTPPVAQTPRPRRPRRLPAAVP